MSESAELISTQRTRDPSRARDGRKLRRAAEIVGFRLLRGGGTRYAEAVIEGLGNPGDAWKTCAECKRPYVQEWAVREMGQAMGRIMREGDDALEIAKRALGIADLAVARNALDLARSVEGMDREGVLDMARKLLENEGWTCLRPSRKVAAEGTNGHGGTDAQGIEAQDR